MQFSSAGNETASKLTGPAFMAGFILCSFVAATVLFANRKNLVEKTDLDRPDAVSDAYLQARASLDPKDMELKYKVARRDAEMGRVSKARQELEQITNTASPARNEALRLELELELQKVFSKPNPSAQQEAVKALLPRIEQYYKAGTFRDPNGKTSFTALERAAKLSEWGGRAALAQQMWEQLAVDGRSEKACANMIRLAKYQSDYRALYRGLEYMSHVRPLAAPEINDMYFAKSTLGENYSEEMLAYYRDYLARYPKEAAVWNTYQFLIESTGDLSRTLETVKARERALGPDVASRNKVAELYWRLGDEEAAFGALDSFKASAPRTETVFWLNYAELAWRLRKDEQAYASAEVLFKEKVGGELMPERMALLKRESNDNASASRIALRAWHSYHKPRFLILALDTAITSKDKGLVKEAYEVAHATETIFVDSDNYWVLKASALMAEAPREEVLDCFETALKINPESPRARRALTWYLVESGWKQKLQLILPLWASYAETDSEMWYPYAIGYELLGNMREALRWCKKEEPRRPSDAAFLVRYANALITAGYAWRGRRMVARAEGLLDLSRPESEDVMLDIFQLKLNNSTQYHGWKKQQALWKKLPARFRQLPETARVMVASALDAELPERARYLTQRVFKNAPLPDWQRFVLAANDNDRAALYGILHSSAVAGIPCQSVADGYARTGDHAAALRASYACLAENPDDGVLRRQAFELARKNSGLARLYYSGSAVGRLEAYGPVFSFMMNRGDSSYSLQAKKGRLGSISSGGPDFRGGGRELDLSAAYEYSVKGLRLEMEAGVNSRDDANSAPYGKGRLSVGEGLRGVLEAEANAIAEETPALRAIGLRDTLALGFEWDITVREFFTTKAGLRLYRERWGQQIGSGYFAEATAGTRLRLEDPEWSLYVSASTLNNTASNLSANALDYYPGGLSAHDVVPREYSSVGAGMLMGNLLPPPLQQGGPAWQLALWNGTSWPGSRYSYYVKFSVNAPLYGRLRLFSDAYYGNTGQNSPGEENKGVQGGVELAF